MKVYYSHDYKVTSKGCAGHLHCNYFQAGKIEKNHYLTWRHYIVSTYRNAFTDQLLNPKQGKKSIMQNYIPWYKYHQQGGWPLDLSCGLLSFGQNK